MFERINKISVQVIVAIICIVSTNGLAYLMFFKELPPANKDVASLMIGQFQGAVIAGIFGWLYSQSKNQPPSK